MENQLDFNILPEACKSNLTSNSFYSHENSLLYVATPKVACTTMKWWFATLNCLIEDINQSRHSFESSPELIIHDTLANISSNFTMLDSSKITSLLNDRKLLRFCLVRNPYARIFSAWQSKWLQRDPLIVGKYIECDFFDMPTTNSRQLAEGFEAFLEYLFTHEETLKDFHIMPQEDFLSTKLIQYDSVTKLEEIHLLNALLEKHLGTKHIDIHTIANRNSNLIPFHPDLITDRAAELIRKIYEVDFNTFNYSESKPKIDSAINEREIHLGLKAVSSLQAKNQRIAELQFEYEDLIELFNQAIQYTECMNSEKLDLFERIRTRIDQKKQQSPLSESQILKLKQMILYKKTQ